MSLLPQHHQVWDKRFLFYILFEIFSKYLMAKIIDFLFCFTNIKIIITIDIGFQKDVIHQQVKELKKENHRLKKAISQSNFHLWMNEGI